MKHLILFLFSCVVLFAHPHTFIDVYIDVKQTNNKIQKIHFQWHIDMMTSQLLLMELDTDMNGKIDESENDFALRSYFGPLQKYNYYTDIKVDNETIATKPINFKTSIIDDKVVYSFDIIIDKTSDSVAIDFYDADRFVAMMIKEEFINSSIEYEIKEIDNDFYFIYRLEFNSKWLNYTQNS